MKKILVFAALPFLFACGHEDPLAGQPDYIRKATPGFQKPEDPVASRETLIISSNQSHFLFTEGTEGQVIISGRVLLPDYQSGLRIDNLSDFTGAKFDPTTGIFTWTPPLGYVTGEDSQRTTFLRVRLDAIEKKRSVTATRTMDFPLSVMRKEKRPVIISETGLPAGPVREGTNLLVTILVEDEDASDRQGMKPRIVIQSPLNKPRVGDLTPYIRLASDDNPSREFSNPKQWRFTLNVALNDMDLTKNSGDFYFRAMVISRFGKMSATKEYRVSVLTSLLAPVLSSDQFDVQAGVALVQDVILIDPRQEGKVEVEVLSPQDLPAGFVLKCATRPLQTWMAVCRASWAVPTPAPTDPNAPTPLPTPTFDPRTEAVVKIRAFNRSPVPSDNYSTFKDYTLKFKVVP